MDGKAVSNHKDLLQFGLEPSPGRSEIQVRACIETSSPSLAVSFSVQLGFGVWGVGLGV